MVLAAFLGCVGMVLGVAGPAAACSCVAASIEELVGYADVMVTGTLTRCAGPVAASQVMSSGDPVTYTVAVERVFKGDASGELELTSAMSGASCGLERMVVDRRYTFFLDAEGRGPDGEPLRRDRRRQGPASSGGWSGSTGPPTRPARTVHGDDRHHRGRGRGVRAHSRAVDLRPWGLAGGRVRCRGHRSGIVAVGAPVPTV